MDLNEDFFKRDRSPFEAALRGIAVNQDGRSSTMTAPNGPSQTLVVQTALMEAKMSHHEAVEVNPSKLILNKHISYDICKL